MQAVIARASKLDADRGGPKHTFRIVFWSVAVVCSILVIVIYGIPLAADRLAPLIPYSVEQRMGDAVDGQVRAMFGSKVCDSAEGRTAFTSMVEKIRIAGGIERPLEGNVKALPVGSGAVIGKVESFLHDPVDVARPMFA